MRELDSVNITEGVNSLREAFRQEALESDVMSKAKVQAQDLMNTMFLPLVRNIGQDYKIEVRFQNAPQRETQGELG
jgi:hypothetical protein